MDSKKILLKKIMYIMSISNCISFYRFSSSRKFTKPVASEQLLHQRFAVVMHFDITLHLTALHCIFDAAKVYTDCRSMFYSSQTVASSNYK